MPYFINDSNADCSGWAVEKEDGEVIGCHSTKQDAIDQMVAVSIAEDMEPGGERALPANYRPALEDNVPAGRACGNCFFYDESNTQDDMAFCTRWDEYVRGDYYCNAWQANETRAVEVPAYVRSAARRGLELRREGYGGDGLTQGTIREARDMAAGRMSDDKVIRANAWAARHRVDLQAAKNSNSDDPEWPGPGAVAHYLWGINPLNPGPARRWLERQADRIKADRNQMSNIETREIHVDDLELRESSEGRTFMGYAAVFNSDSEPLPFTERINPGAFKRTLSSRNNIKMFVNHNDDQVLATTRSGTLRLREDSRGLFAEADLPNTTYGNDLAELLRTRVVDSMSFGFSVPNGGDEWSDDGATRTLNEIRLHEVSVVTGWPAYPATTATIRKLDQLAQRTQQDADALADALSALEAGETLDDSQASILRNVVDTLAPEPEQVEKEPTVPLSVLRQQLDLIYKTI